MTSREAEGNARASRGDSLDRGSLVVKISHQDGGSWDAFEEDQDGEMVPTQFLKMPTIVAR